MPRIERSRMSGSSQRVKNLHPPVQEVSTFYQSIALNLESQPGSDDTSKRTRFPKAK